MMVLHPQLPTTFALRLCEFAGMAVAARKDRKKINTTTDCNMSPEFEP